MKSRKKLRPDCLPHVFDCFRQVEGENSAKGWGLGLAIARHIGELHYGTIHAHRVGEGQGVTLTDFYPWLIAIASNSFQS